MTSFQFYESDIVRNFHMDQKHNHFYLFVLNRMKPPQTYFQANKDQQQNYTGGQETPNSEEFL